MVYPIWRCSEPVTKSPVTKSQNRSQTSTTNSTTNSSTGTAIPSLASVSTPIVARRFPEDPRASILRDKRPPLADISPVNHKRTNNLVAQINVGPHNGNAVTPIQGEEYKFPNGLYNRSYLPVHENEHFVRSSIDWRWKQQDGVRLDKELYRVMHDDMSKAKSSGKKSDGIDLEFLASAIWLFLSFLYPQRKHKIKAKALVESIFIFLLNKYPEYFQDTLLESCRKYCRQNVTVPYKIQRTIDTQPTGGLNLGCIESIRKGVEELQKREQGFIPSCQTVARVAKALERHAVDEYGFTINEAATIHGPVYSFDAYNIIRQVCKAFQLEEYAITGSGQPPVQLTYTMDGAQLTNELGHVTGGIKVVDPRAVDPLTGIPLSVTGKFQSRDLSFVCQLAFVKDSKATYKDCFEEFLTTFNQQSIVIPATATEPELSNFEVSSCQDLSSGWKTTQLGGGCHTTNYFCPQCMVSRHTMTLSKVGADRCNMCVECDISNCYCHSVCDPSMLEATRRSIEDYIDKTYDEDCKLLYKIRKQSKLSYDEGTANQQQILCHVDYQPVSRKEWSDFKSLIVNEIKLRLSASTQKDQLRNILGRKFEDQRSALKEMVDCEESILFALSTVQRHDRARNLAVALAVEKLIPCILHMKMRLGEKIFQVIVNMGLERYEEGLVDSSQRKKFVIELQSVIQTHVFGNPTTGRVAQWSFTWAPGNRRMAKFAMSGVTASKLMRGLSLIVKTIFSPNLDQESTTESQAELIRNQNSRLESQWLLFCENLILMWECIEKKDDFSHQDLVKLHKYTSKFISQWIELCEGKHMTNYIHVLGAGHLTYFAKHYGNLYRFSQQGWESLNKLIKHFYYNNTNHGGSYGNGGKDENGLYTKGTISGQHCYPLMRFCQRFMMWKLGHGDKFFEALSNSAQDTKDQTVKSPLFGVCDQNSDSHQMQFGII
jgi:hypothetical protein